MQRLLLAVEPVDEVHDGPDRGATESGRPLRNGRRTRNLDLDVEALAGEEPSHPAAADLLGLDDARLGAVLTADLFQQSLQIRAFKQQAQGRH